MCFHVCAILVNILHLKAGLSFPVYIIRFYDGSAPNKSFLEFPQRLKFNFSCQTFLTFVREGLQCQRRFQNPGIAKIGLTPLTLAKWWI